MDSKVRKDFFRGVYYTAIAKYAGIVVSLVVVAVLSRLISPEDFGIVAIATIIIQLFGTISDLGIGSAVIQYKTLTKKDLSNIFSFSVWVGLTFTALFFFLSWPISSYYQNDTLLLISQILSVSLFFSIINTVPNALLYKNKEFKFITYRTLAVQITGGVMSVTAAICGLGLYALIINPLFSSIALIVINLRKYPQKLSFTLGLSSIKSIFSFSSYQFLFDIINYFSRNLDKLIIGRYLGLDKLGYYEKSYRLMMLPLQNITHVVGPVMHPIFSDYQQDYNRLSDSYQRVVRYLALVGFPLSVLLFFTARELTLLVFGPAWVPSVASFKILALSVGVQVVLSTSGSIFQASSSTKHLFISGLLSSATTITAIFISIIFYNSLESVAWAITISFIANFFQAYIIMYYYVFKKSILPFFKQLIPSLTAASILIISNLALNYFFEADNLLLSLVVKSAVNGIIALSFVQLTNEYDILGQLKFLWNKKFKSN